jgi:hypothetical protein
VCSDGVSNSQLETFVRHEMRDFESAFRKFNLQIKLTVVVVQKRITNRLFFQCPGPNKCYLPKCNGSEAFHSPPPGTHLILSRLLALFSSVLLTRHSLVPHISGCAVNEEVASSELRDFFLVPSIAPPNATARPTRTSSLLSQCRSASLRWC